MHRVGGFYQALNLSEAGTHFLSSLADVGKMKNAGRFPVNPAESQFTMSKVNMEAKTYKHREKIVSSYLFEPSTRIELHLRADWDEHQRKNYQIYCSQCPDRKMRLIFSAPDIKTNERR